MLPLQGELRVEGALSIFPDKEGANMVYLEGAEGSGGLCFDFQAEPLDLRQFTHAAVHIENQSQGRIDARLTVKSDPDAVTRVSQARNLLNPGETDQIQALLVRDFFPKDHPWTLAFGKTRGLPGGHFGNAWRYLDLKNIRYVKLVLHWKDLPVGQRKLVVSSPYGVGDYTTDQIDPELLPMPIVDKMGQWVGEEWPGRVSDIAELASDGKRDLAIYEDSPVLSVYSQYGGWKNGPRLKATGRFRVEKLNEQWWFIDPEGYLFWSLGVTCVGELEPTKISGRERFFPELQGTPRGRDIVYDFIGSNLKRKYGDAWIDKSTAVTLGRMRAWGLNTAGCWSAPGILGNKKVPYTLFVYHETQTLGKLAKIPDPFSEEFRDSLLFHIKEAARNYAGDPWNLGVFIHNEMKWGSGTEVAENVIDLDNAVPAKRAFIEMLSQKYGDIEKLNQAWGTSFSSFDRVQGVSEKSTTESYQSDMEAYTEYHADTYFSYCREMTDRYLPGHLYFGCRFHSPIYNGNNVYVQKAKSRYVDVMSYNVYRNSIHDIVTHQEVDRPVLIGEFHFGTISHGVWAPGLGTAANIEGQAELFKAYVQEAIEHPNFVGAHWFQYSDHITTGRYDGENYRIGFVSITDRSYDVLTDAVRETAEEMYPLRYGE